MKTYFRLLQFFFLVCFSFGLVSADELNENGQYSLTIPEFEKTIYNDDLVFDFSFTIRNNENFDQEIDLVFEELAGWDINTEDLSILLSPNEAKVVEVEFKANSEFEYSKRFSGQDYIKIKLNDGYSGVVYFPVTVLSGDEQVDFVFEGNILSKEDTPVYFIPRISSSKVNPVTPLGFSVESKDLFRNEAAQVEVFIDEEKIYSKEHMFEQNHQYQVYQQMIPENYNPGRYTVELIVRHESTSNSAREWNAREQIIVEEYKNLEVESEFSKNLIKDNAKLIISNKGNVDDVYSQEIEHGGFMSLFFGAEFASGKDIDYVSEGNVVTLEVPLEKGESVEIYYYYNFIPLYVILFVIAILIMYIYSRKTSNPLSVETRVYEVKKDSHEGVKSLKLRIGFENIRSEEIDSLKMIFRMPSYLSVKDDSFLLTPPKQVLKGKSHYKLIWDFKRFEKEDSRILGFQMVNSKGILGDVRLEDLEFEVKINGRVKRYYTSFPVIRG